MDSAVVVGETARPALDGGAARLTIDQHLRAALVDLSQSVVERQRLQPILTLDRHERRLCRRAGMGVDWRARNHGEALGLQCLEPQPISTAGDRRLVAGGKQYFENQEQHALHGYGDRLQTVEDSDNDGPLISAPPTSLGTVMDG